MHVIVFQIFSYSVSISVQLAYLSVVTALPEPSSHRFLLAYIFCCHYDEGLNSPLYEKVKFQLSMVTLMMVAESSLGILIFNDGQCMLLSNCQI